MDTINCILKRRSIRKFKDNPVTNDEIKILLDCAMAAPSACNKQPWEFFVISNQEKMEEIRNVSRFARYNAPQAIVVCGNKNRSLSEKDNDFWIQDCASAIENILLAATAMNLGAVWCGLYPMEGPTEKMKEVLGVDDKIVPLGLIYIGHPVESLESRTQYCEDYVHYL